MISSRNTAHFASTRKQGKIPQAACCWPSSKARTTYPVAERTKAVTHSLQQAVSSILPLGPMVIPHKNHLHVGIMCRKLWITWYILPRDYAKGFEKDDTDCKWRDTATSIKDTMLCIADHLRRQPTVTEEALWFWERLERQFDTLFVGKQENFSQKGYRQFQQAWQWNWSIQSQTKKEGAVKGHKTLRSRRNKAELALWDVWRIASSRSRRAKQGLHTLRVSVTPYQVGSLGGSIGWWEAKAQNAPKGLEDVWAAKELWSMVSRADSASEDWWAHIEPPRVLRSMADEADGRQGRCNCLWLSGFGFHFSYVYISFSLCNETSLMFRSWH